MLYIIFQLCYKEYCVTKNEKFYVSVNTPQFYFEAHGRTAQLGLYIKLWYHLPKTNTILVGSSSMTNMLLFPRQGP